MAMLKWEQFRPRNEWLIVRGDPRVKKTKGGIILTENITGIERVMEGSGTVLKVGPTVAKALGRMLEPGTRIAYRGFLKDATFQEFEPVSARECGFAGDEFEDRCPVFLLHAKDVLAELAPDMNVGFFS